ncbi:MAG TPA: nucleotidyltransferase domain-containing protein [Vicinamibacterales bacterium]|nr:nucleotidyltransferase domain-containing protein [Acidobacteriota bacterium]HQX80818.1 nucleotidyltransferase domain-containing protein [Vicinamibacterales bacterium]
MTPSQTKAIASVLDADARIAYGLVFGSTGRGDAHTGSDLDVAIGLAPDAEFDALGLGRLVSDLERASGQTIDLVLLHEASPALAYRVFRDGVVVCVRDRPALVERRVRAILDYLDYRPFESAFVRGVLQARG